ncbi:hypothetical protein D0T53_05450 [Dysgonomonas sp. 216]|nr:hypothetical protein [Dysgonomonas sp. 216]
MAKKDYSIEFLKAFEPFVHLKDEKFKIISETSNVFECYDLEHKLFFIIKNYEQTGRDGQVLLRVLQNPASSTKKESSSKSVRLSDLSKVFQAWLDMLDEYDKVNSFYDDPIVSAFADEYYAEFEFVDKDADIKPFGIKRILAIDSFLESTQQKLSQYLTEENQIQIEDIQNDITELRENLTSKSKKWVARKISIIWAKMTKQGLQFVKDFVKEGKKQMIEIGVKFLIETGKNIIE